MAYVWLFGPPGIGKSTLVDRARARGYVAFDFEDIWQYPDLVKDQVHWLNAVSPERQFGVIGAAGLSPKLEYPGVKLLLVLSQPEYHKRREARDKIVSEKASQTAHIISDWVRLTKWDAIVNANEEALNFILARYRRIES